MNGKSTIPLAVSALVIAGGELGGAGSIVRVNVAVPVPAALLALRVTLNVPAAVGVPDTAPVVVLTESPAGSPVALKLLGLLLAVIA